VLPQRPTKRGTKPINVLNVHFESGLGQAKDYPNMLVKTSFNDSQVMYWEPAKYVAKLRALRTDQNVLLLKTKLDPAGHAGASGRYERLKDKAFDYAFALTEMGISH